MDFDDSPADAQFRRHVRGWLETHVPPKVALSAPSIFLSRGPDDLPEARRQQRQLAADRLAGITWPEEHGGRGGTIMQQIIFAEEAAGFDLATDIFLLGTALAGPTIIAHGTEAQKARFLPPLLRGDEVWCQLFSEPDAGSDLASMRTRATRDGDDWVVSGQKVWTSGAHYSDWGILPARSDPDQPKHHGITYFLVDMRSPGITVKPLRQLTGDVHFNEVFLDEVRIPDWNRLGEINDGWRVTQTTLMNERLMIGAGHSGSDPQAVIALAQKAEFTTTEDPVVRQSLVDLYIRSRLTEFMRYRLLTALAKGEAPGPEGSVLKLATAEALRRQGNVALALQGPAGTLDGSGAPEDGVWQAGFLAAPALRIAGGSDEIQRNIIAERVLGLPREKSS